MARQNRRDIFDPKETQRDTAFVRVVGGVGDRGAGWLMGRSILLLVARGAACLWKASDSWDSSWAIR